MKMKDMIKKAPAELHKLILEKEGELREFRFGSAGAGGKKNVRFAREARKVIARAHTILTAQTNQETK